MHDHVYREGEKKERTREENEKSSDETPVDSFVTCTEMDVFDISCVWSFQYVRY